jgi:hypothetical protein
MADRPCGVMPEAASQNLIPYGGLVKNFKFLKEVKILSNFVSLGSYKSDGYTNQIIEFANNCGVTHSFIERSIAYKASNINFLQTPNVIKYNKYYIFGQAALNRLYDKVLGVSAEGFTANSEMLYGQINPKIYVLLPTTIKPDQDYSTKATTTVAIDGISVLKTNSTSFTQSSYKGWNVDGSLSDTLSMQSFVPSNKILIGGYCENGASNNMLTYIMHPGRYIKINNIEDYITADQIETSSSIEKNGAQIGVIPIYGKGYLASNGVNYIISVKNGLNGQIPTNGLY